MTDITAEVRALFGTYQNPVTIQRIKGDLPVRATEGSIRSTVAVLVRAGELVVANWTTPMQFERAELEKERAANLVIGEKPCGYCSPNNTLNYHKEKCPRTIRGAAGRGKDWGCPCHFDGHKKARDYEG